MFMKNLYVINKYWYTFIQNKFGRYNLTSSDYGILMYLFNNDGVNQDNICTHFVMDKGTVAKSAARLEENGYIKRQINAKNKREKNIYLTSSGKEIAISIKEAMQEWDNKCLSGLTEDEINLFSILSQKISDNARKNIKLYKEGK